MATTKIDLAVGLVGLQSDWNTTMRIYQVPYYIICSQACPLFFCKIKKGLIKKKKKFEQDVTSTNKNKAVVDASSPDKKAQSIQSNLISLVITGSPGIFSR